MAALDPLRQREGAFVPTKPPRGCDTPFASPLAPVPWPSASRLLRWQPGHSWKPHLAQLQWVLKKPRWQASQSWGAPAPRLQPITPAGNTALSLPGVPSVTPRPGPHLPSWAPGHVSLSLHTAWQKLSPRTPSRYLARQRLLPPQSGSATSGCSVPPSASPRVQMPSTVRSPLSPRVNLGERGNGRGCFEMG